MKLRNWNRTELKTVRQACDKANAQAIMADALMCAGNLCRCAGYASQIGALVKYAEGRRAK